MSGGLLQYSGLVTKTRAMHGRLLSPEECAWLAEFENVEDFIAFLKEARGYGDIYRSHEEIHHRSQVEAVIRNSLFSDYGKLYQFACGAQREGLEIIFLRYETDVLKACLEHAYQGECAKNLSYLNLFFNLHSDFDTEMLIQAKNMTELMAVLAGTHYEALMLPLREDSSCVYADYAFALDVFYYKRAWKQKEKLSEKTMKQIITQILGTEIDWQNILWMYRGKRFYRMKQADLAAYLIPLSYRLKKTEQKAMLEAETIEEFMAVLGNTVYFTGKDAVIKMGDELAYRKVMDKTYQAVCKKYPQSLAPVLKYLHDKEQEIDRLTTILEGIRYRIPPREIQGML